MNASDSHCCRPIALARIQVKPYPFSSILNRFSASSPANNPFCNCCVRDKLAREQSISSYARPTRSLRTYLKQADLFRDCHIGRRTIDAGAVRAITGGPHGHSRNNREAVFCQEEGEIRLSVGRSGSLVYEGQPRRTSVAKDTLPNDLERLIRLIVC